MGRKGKKQTLLKKSVLGHSLTGPSNASSHVDSVPNELLSEIFRYCTAMQTVEDFESSRKSAYTHSVAISHVSRKWREISITQPTCWSKIFVDLNSLLASTSLDTLVNIYLERSKNALLDVCVLFNEYGFYDRFTDEDEDEEDEDDNDKNGGKGLALLPTLFKHANRWRSAVLRLPTSDALERTCFPRQFPLLQQLDLRCIPGPDDDACSDIAPSFDAPTLHSLAVDRFGFGGDFGSTCLDKITLTWPTPDTVARYLRDASSMCTVEIISAFTPYRDFGTARVTSQLRALSFVADSEAEDDAEAIGEVLGALTLPNLEQLAFINEYDQHTFPVSKLLAMLSRSDSTITKFTRLQIEGHRISTNDLLEILAKVPALTYLGFTEFDGEGPLTTSFFQSLMGSHELSLGSERAKLLPNLSHICLAFHSESVPLNDLISFLESRRTSTQKPILQNAHVSLKSKFIPKLEKGVSGLRSGGLDVVIAQTY